MSIKPFLKSFCQKFQNTNEEQIHENGTKNGTHKCEKCNYSSDIKSNVVRHFRVAHDLKFPRHEKCKKCNSYVRNLKRHHRIFHKMYICKVCNKNFDSLDGLRRHTKPDKNAVKTYKCAQCEYSTTGRNSRNSFIAHLYVHTRDREDKYRCDKCPFTAAYKCSLKKHSLLHLQKQASFHCHLCPFVSFASLRKHLMLEHNFSENDFNSIVYQCEKCEYSTNNKQYLASHNVVHSKPGEYRFKCDKCTFATNRCSEISKHRKTHSNTICKKVKTLKTVQCAECDFTTTDKRLLMDHVMKHSKARNYVFNCDKCTFGTNFRYRLANHMLLHAPESERIVTTYRCDKCKFTSVYKSSLRGHILTHSKDRKYKYNCDKCPFTSNCKTYFTIHSNRHSENREFNYRCDKCPFATSYKRSLKQHSVLHSENREYNLRCNKCSYATNLKGNLVTHIRAMHSQEPKDRKNKRKRSKTVIRVIS